MPIQLFFVRNSPESNPMFNEKARKVNMELLSKRDELYKKHELDYILSVVASGNPKVSYFWKAVDGTRVHCPDCLLLNRNESCSQFCRSYEYAKEQIASKLNLTSSFFFY